jgi:hypothetical protein
LQDQLALARQAFVDFWVTLRQSSMKPMPPKPAVTKITTHRYWLEISAQISVPARMPARMMKPPMVGVPALATIWLSGPSSRIG